MTLSHALDRDIAAIIERLMNTGVKADSTALYQAIQRSNSSLKRRPKKVLEESIGRVLEELRIPGDSSDSEAAAEQEQAKSFDADVMNRALRQSMAAQRSQPASPPAEATQARKRKTNGEALPKRQKTDSHDPPSNLSLRDLGGMDNVLKQFENLLMMPLGRPEAYKKMGLEIPRGILLHGPPGCGKTAITRAYAAFLGIPFIQLLGPSVVSGMSGESERGIREKFDEAKKNAPALIFIDEIDAIAPKRESSQSQMEKRIVAQLLLSMDSLGEDDKPVIVLAATNRPDSIDPALRRGGRFDAEICIGVPSEATRVHILQARTRSMPLADDIDLTAIAKRTAGFVGADLQTLVSRAGAWQMNALKDALLQQGLRTEGFPVSAANGLLDNINLSEVLWRSIRNPETPDPLGFGNLALTMEAFTSVLPDIIPSSKREGFATIPDVSWNDIGALQRVREELEMAIVQPIVNPGRFAKFGISAPTGVLLCGPPGCGKTLLARAVAAESKANFISVKGPELLDKYLGESEAAVRRVFTRARASAPCIVFFDELDALTPRRDGSSSEASARVVNMLLTELDGMNDRGDVFVVGATNRPDIIDEAMMRPGRLETILFIDLPGPSERVDILRTIVRSKDVSSEIANLAAGEACEGFTGADLRALWRKAAQNALKRDGDAVIDDDFKLALAGMQKSVLDPKRYEAMKHRFTKGR